MTLFLDNRSGQPIYEQLFQQISQQIISGELPEGAPLPSIRGLAKDLQISVITTKKAYDILEQKGLIDTVPGKGCYVAKRNLEIIREHTLRQLEEHLQEVLRLARTLHLSRQDLLSMMDLLSDASDETMQGGNTP